MPTIAVAQSTSNSGSVVNSLTATLNGVTAGSTLIATVFWSSDSFTATASDSQTANGNFGAAVETPTEAGGSIMKTFVKQNAEAGTHTVTASLTGSPSSVVIVFEEISGAAATGQPDRHSSNVDTNGGSGQGTDGESSGATAALALQPALVYGICFDAQATNIPSAGTGYASSNNGTAVSVAWRSETKRVTATTAVTATWTGTSSPATHLMTVVVIDELAGPSISAQPSSTSVYGGGTATFSVTATGAGGLTYQWSRNGSPITGATSSSYTTPALNANDNQTYFTCDITDSNGTTTSAQAWLTWTAPLVPAVNYVGFLPGLIGEMLTAQAPATPAAGQTEWSPGRAPSMGHGYLNGEPLPGAIALVVRYGGWDQGPPLSRPQRDPQPLGVDAVDGIGAVAATGDVSGARSRAARPVLPGTVDPAPPSAQPAAGHNVTPSWARSLAPRVSVSGEAIATGAQTSVGVAGTFESSIPEARPGRSLVDVGGTPAPPSAQPSAGITSFASASRPLPARVFVAGESVEPSAVPAAGSSVTSPTARPPAPRVFVAGEPLEPVPNGWAPDAAPAPARAPRRLTSDQVVAVPAIAVVVLTAWGYEPVQPRGRVSRLAPAGAAGEPVPRVLTTSLVAVVDVAAPLARASRRLDVPAVNHVVGALGSAVGIDAPAPATSARRQLRAQPAPADAIPTITAAWGWEASVTGVRAPRPILVVGVDAVAALATAFPAAEASPSPSRAPRAGQGGVPGEAIDHVVVVVPGGFEPSPAFARVTKAEIRSGAFSLPIFLIVPPPIWVMGAGFSIATAAVVTVTSVTAPFAGSEATDASPSVTSAGVPSSSTSVTDG